MIEFEVKKLKVQVFPKNIKVIDSYKIETRKEMREFLTETLEKAPLYYTKRTINALIRE